MKNIYQVMENFKETKDFKLLKEEAGEILKREGLIELPLGSYWKWIHIEWFNKALAEDVIAENAYGQFIPRADVIISMESTGKEGTEVLKKVE